MTFTTTDLADRQARAGGPPAPGRVPGPASRLVPDSARAPERTRIAEAELAGLRPLLAAEAAAEAVGAGVEAADLEQAVLVRLLERPHPPPDRAAWLRAAVRFEARLAARLARREIPYGFGQPPAAAPCAAGLGAGAEQQVLAAEEGRALRAAVRLLPGRCPDLVSALLSRRDPTYREISRELGVPQGSLGPLRSRCLGCLRTVLVPRIGGPVDWGKAG